jgi:hypothetical protein
VLLADTSTLPLPVTAMPKGPLQQPEVPKSLAKVVRENPAVMASDVRVSVACAGDDKATVQIAASAVMLFIAGLCIFCSSCWGWRFNASANLMPCCLID